MQNLIVQKYGGASLATPEKIKKIAERIATARSSGKKLLVAVSAMGSSTDELIRLAHQISKRPAPRELDMLVSTGERVSMSLMSMALQELQIPAISFTGSQAGIITDESHVNARIIEVRAFRVKEALEQNKVVVLAGFQGVSAAGKEITTLGRGGTDTTAIAMASYLNAERVEILKEVPGIMTADPKLLTGARGISRMSVQQLGEMTFWGAKVLHYRSVELAWQKNMEIFIGSAMGTGKSEFAGTVVSKENEKMLEQPRVLAISSHAKVLCLEIENEVPGKNAAPAEHSIAKGRASGRPNAIELLHASLQRLNIAIPQFLLVEQNETSSRFYITAPSETLAELLDLQADGAEGGFVVARETYCVVTATCIGSHGDELLRHLLKELNQVKIYPTKVSLSSMSVHFFLPEQYLEQAIEVLHSANAVPG